MATQIQNHVPTVSVRKSVSVYPKTLHPQHILKLSNLDRQCPNLVYIVLFYKPNTTTSFQNLSLDSVFSSLKSGLEQTLSVWYPAAGRLSANPADGKLNIWCNNKGTVLLEAVTRVKISELGDLSEYNEFYEKLVYKPPSNGDFSQMPLFVAQVTRFGCGGYSIGIGASHSLFDGPATYDFLRAWASNSAITKQTGIAELSKPEHDRGRLLTVANNHPTPARAAAIDHLYQLITHAANDNDHCGSRVKGMTMGGGGQNSHFEMQNSDYVLKTFHLSSATIEGLKRKLIGERRANFSCSTFELVAAHIWKTRTKVLGLKKERMVFLQFSVGTRTKLSPPLPNGFSGNAYVLASVALTAREVDESNYETIIEKIKEAKNLINNDYVNTYIAALNGPSVGTTLPPLKELTLVSDWTRMPFHNVDFMCGGQGVAAYASPLASPMPQVAYLMRNPNELRGIDMRIGLLPHTVDDFTRYFLTN